MISPTPSNVSSKSKSGRDSRLDAKRLVEAKARKANPKAASQAMPVKDRSGRVFHTSLTNLLLLFQDKRNRAESGIRRSLRERRTNDEFFVLSKSRRLVPHRAAKGRENEAKPMPVEVEPPISIRRRPPLHHVERRRIRPRPRPAKNQVERRRNESSRTRSLSNLEPSRPAVGPGRVKKIAAALNATSKKNIAAVKEENENANEAVRRTTERILLGRKSIGK